MPKISIIIPVYNVEKYLAKCLDSVINQTLEDIEIICIDDCSTDNSLSILKEYQEKDSRIQVIALEKNVKQGGARNRGLDIAKGKYIMFVDSDDKIRADACEILYNKCKLLDLDMLCFGGNNFNNITGEEEYNYYYNFTYLPKNWNKEVFSYKDVTKFITSIAVSSCLTIYKKNFIKNYNIEFPVGLCFEDNIFFLKALLNAEKIGIEKTRLYQRRIHPESTMQNIDKHFLDLIEISRLVLYYLKEQNVDEQIYKKYLKKYTRNVKAHFSKLNIILKYKYHQKVVHFLKESGCSPKLSEYSLIEKIFSIKNSKNKKYKIIMLFGIKITINRSV